MNIARKAIGWYPRYYANALLIKIEHGHTKESEIVSLTKSITLRVGQLVVHKYERYDLPIKK